MKSARRRNEIVPKTAGKLCNREEPGPVYILYRRVAQHTEFVISEAGSCFFFFFFFLEDNSLPGRVGLRRRRFLPGTLTSPAGGERKSGCWWELADGRGAETRGQWGPGPKPSKSEIWGPGDPFKEGGKGWNFKGC